MSLKFYSDPLISLKLKNFLSGIPESFFGMESTPAPAEVQLTYSNINRIDRLNFLGKFGKAGVKLNYSIYAAITVEQANEFRLTSTNDKVSFKLGDFCFLMTPLRKITESDLKLFTDFKDEDFIPKTDDILVRITAFVPKPHSLLIKNGLTGSPLFQPPKKVLLKILSLLYYCGDNFEEQLNTLKKEGGKYDANLLMIGQILETADLEIQKEITKLILQKNYSFKKDIVSVIKDGEKTKLHYSHLNVDPVNSINSSIDEQALSIIHNWRTNQMYSPIVKIDNEGRRSWCEHRKKELYDELIQLQSLSGFEKKIQETKLLRKTLAFNGITG